MVTTSVYINTYLSEDLIADKVESGSCLNIFVDIRSVTPAFFNENLMKAVVNDEQAIDLFVRKSLVNFVKFLDYHVSLALKLNVTPRFFFFSDTGKSEYHFQIDKDYKANRGSPIILTEAEYMRSKKLANGMLGLFANIVNFIPGFYYIHLDHMESDFIPYFVMKNFNFQENETFVILSRDKDLGQCLSLYPKCYQAFLHTKKGKVILSDSQAIPFHLLKSEEETILPSHLIPLFLAIVGDASDNVVGIKGVGYKKLYNALLNSGQSWVYDNFVNLERFLSSELSKKSDLTVQQLVFDNKDLVVKNLKLVDFRYISNHITSHIVDRIYKVLKRSDYRLSDSDIKDFIRQLKESTHEDFYPYHLINYIRSVSALFR